jgi:hypothetical protein
MKANNYISKISKREHKLLLVVSFAAFVFSIAGFLTYNIKADLAKSEYFREQEINEAENKPVLAGPYCFPDKHPQFLFSIILLAGSTFISLYFTQRYLLPFLFTIASLTMFGYWFFDTREALFYAESDFIKGVDRFFYNAGDFDLAVFFLSSILLFWQISILLRMLIKTTQKENGLP